MPHFIGVSAMLLLAAAVVAACAPGAPPAGATETTVQPGDGADQNPISPRQRRERDGRHGGGHGRG